MKPIAQVKENMLEYISKKWPNGLPELPIHDLLSTQSMSAPTNILWKFTTKL